MNVLSLANHRPPLVQMDIRQLSQLSRAGDERARETALARLDAIEAALEHEADHDVE